MVRSIYLRWSGGDGYHWHTSTGNDFADRGCPRFACPLRPENLSTTVHQPAEKCCGGDFLPSVAHRADHVLRPAGTEKDSAPTECR